MSNFTEWAEDKIESFPATEILSLKTKENDFACHLCTVCDKITDGFDCGAEECPNNPPLFI